MVSKSNKKACIFCVLLSSCIISSMVQTALNTALALIMEEMSVSAGTAQWLASSYSLVMGIMVLSTAFLIRRYPSRPLYLSFMSLFSLGLLLAALSPSFWVLLLGRVLQAVGCGLLMSLTQVVILSVYPPETRGSVMGLYGLAVCAAPVLAPTLTGIIIDSMGWQMVFWIALGASVITLGIGFFTMGNVTETTPISFDILSLLLCAAGFASLVVGLGNWSSYKIISVPVLGLVVGGLGFLLLFVKRQQQLSVPFLNLKAFANLEFRLSVLSSMLIYCSMMAVSTLLPLYNQSLRGVSATTSGLIMMPGSLVTALISPVAGKIHDRFGIRKLYLIGGFLILTGHISFCLLTTDTPVAIISVLFLVRQLGIGMLMMTTVTWGMSTLQGEMISDGTAIISSLRTVSGAIGSAVFVSIMSAVAGRSDVAAMMCGIRAAFAGIALLSAVLFLLAVLCIGRKKTVTAERSS